MARSVLLRMLLLGGFLLGQWMAVAHAAGHEALTPGDLHCHVCSIAHAAPVAPALPVLPCATLRHETIVRTAGARAPQGPRQAARSRGPPA